MQEYIGGSLLAYTFILSRFMQVCIENGDEFFIVGGTGKGRNLLGKERGRGADVIERVADYGVGAGVDGFDVVGCGIGDGVL